MVPSFLLMGALAAAVVPEKVAFFGDSITEAGQYLSHVQFFSALRHPGEGIECHNVGKGGDSAGGGLARWAWDAAPIKPDRVVVMFGMNDSERDTLPTPSPTNAADAVRREGIVAKYRANMDALLDLISRDCPRITVMTPTPYDQYGTQPCRAFMGGNEPMLAEFAQIVRGLAAEKGLTLVDLHRPMTQLLKDHPDVRIVGGDRIHPSDLGQFLMACLYLKATGESPLVGETRIDAAGRESVAFEYRPSTLPLPVTDVYLRAEKLWPVTDCLNREMLIVENLPRGTYALRVDGRELGRFNEVQLRGGVNLALLDTPNRRVADQAEKIRVRLCEIESGFRSVNYLVKWMKDLNISFDNRGRCQAFFNERREQAKKLAWGGWHRRCVDKLEAMIPRWNALKDEEKDLRAKLRAIRPRRSNFSLVSVAEPFFSADIHPYGVCAHVTRSERGAHRLKGSIRSMELAGIRYVRCDFDRWAMKRPDGSWNFANYDALVNELEAHGITILPILYGDKKPPFDMEEYKEYIRTIVRHFRRRLPAVEIWNEANLRDCFRESPQEYAKILKAAYEAVKSVDPSILVAYTGTAGVPSDWIRKTFEAGAASCFDIMNVHPYSHPAQPECSMDTRLERLRRLMAEFGIAEKPIWITEIGWPTHTLSLRFSNIILSGLKVARPEQKTWKMIMIDFPVDGPEPDQSVAEQLEELLPYGSEVVLCTQSEANRRLAAGGVDAVVYPFDEYFPSETIDSVNEFIRTGGVLVEVGGLPCYFGRRNGESVKGMQHGGAVGRFPFGYRAWWTGAPGTYPASCQVFATERGLAAGVKQEPTGFKAERYLVPDRAGKDAEWIPLIAGKTASGTEVVGAAVIRYHGDRTGAAVLCSLYGTDGIWGTNSEENQAKFTARGAALAFAEGVQAYFPYVLRAYEDDPYYSEDHFGLMHADFQPKPAYSAYANFTRERPEGSVNRPVVWHDAERTLYYPQWTRPDGCSAGMIWFVGEPALHALHFTGGEPSFRNMYGCKLWVRKIGEGDWSVRVGDAPIYFSGAELVSAGKISSGASPVY